MRKRNLLKIPQIILDRIRTFDQDDIVVASAKFVRHEDIKEYVQLGIKYQNGTLILPKPFIPNPNAGKYSRANAEGQEKLRADLPKISKEIYCGDRPIYGDWSKGSFSLWQTRKVYRRDFISPKQVELSSTLLEEKDGGFIIKFSIEQVINRHTKNFESELLYNLNILQENIGAANVFPSAASLAEYAATVQVDWQILPPGKVDDVVKNILKGKKKITPEQESTIKERIAVMAKLKPEAYITGTDSFFRYFGAKFGDDFVVFENIQYGNAIYVLYDSWQKLSQKSRMELLAGPRDGFDRIEHKDGWVKYLEALVANYRESKG